VLVVALSLALVLVREGIFLGWVGVIWFEVVFGSLLFVLVFRWEMRDDRNNAEGTSTALEKWSRPLNNRSCYSVSLAWV